jgi:Fic family protein
MNSLGPGFIERQPIPQSLLQTVRILGECKGKQQLFKEQAPQVLESLRLSAIIQSTEASNRIEGVVAASGRIREIVSMKSLPKNRSEQEIAGYRDVLKTIHSNYDSMDFTTGLVLQLHRDLYQFHPSVGGTRKSSDNAIEETLSGGRKSIRFKPVPASLTPDAMERLHHRLNDLRNESMVEPLLLIPAYILDFLCIHPFRDGNGRMARLLTLLLLYQSGYEVGRYISLEGMVEDNRDGYYDSLGESSRGWHESTHSLLPWWGYFLGVMLLGAYREFGTRVGAVIQTHGAKRQMVIDFVLHQQNPFMYADVERACPVVSRPTINRALAELRKQGIIRCSKPGRDAVWEKRDHD